MDTATPQLWTETVFGLTSGWWRFTDRDLRPEQPLLERAQWESVLQEAGFGETASLPGLIGPPGRRTDRSACPQGVAASAPRRRSPESRRRRKNRGSFLPTIPVSASDLAAQLRAAGRALPCRPPRRAIRRGRRRMPSPCARKRRRIGRSSLRSCANDVPPERIVYLWSLDAPTGTNADDALMGTDALLHLSQALETTQSAGEAAHRSRSRAARSRRAATMTADRRRASAGRRLAARHPERIPEPLLPRHRSAAGSFAER